MGLTLKLEVGCRVGLGFLSDLLTPSRFGAAGWAEAAATTHFVGSQLPWHL